MEKPRRHPKDPTSRRQIVGFSLPPETAAELKAEAGRRSISLRKLLEEMWALYKKQGRADA